MAGHIADVISMQEVQLEQLPRYRVVCVLRPRQSNTLDQILKRCESLGIRTVADVDDLVFTPKYAAESPSVINNQASEFSVRAQFKRNLQAMSCFDEITTATEPLAHHWGEQSDAAPVTVIPNGLSPRWLKTAVTSNYCSQNHQPTITYLPGSRSHNEDFRLIADVLADVLNSRKELKLLIVGSLDIADGQFPARQLLRASWVEYFSLPHVIAASTVTLAPLTSSPFNHSKSHIKFIESAAFGTPAICSPNYDICRHESSGLQIANSVDEWHAAIHSVLQNTATDAVRDAMKHQVRSAATAHQSADLLINMLTQSVDSEWPNAAGL